MSETENQLFDKVHGIIEKEIRPFIEADGGMINLESVVGGNVFIKLAGACVGCPGAVMTLKGGVERILKMKIPEVDTVQLAM